MKILYEESPKSFEEALVSLLPSAVNLSVGPNFSQQTKTEGSIPDLSITQRSFSVFFETKLTNWFYDDQTFRHITGINSQAQDKILFLLSNFESDEPEIEFNEQISRARQNQVVLQPISFEEFVQVLEDVKSSESFEKVLDEFKAYLDRSNLLPKWKYLLTVVNCADSMNEISAGVYICPDIGGTYSFRRAKFIGSYANKKVNTIFEVKAVISISVGLEEGFVKWNNCGEAENNLIDEAKDLIRRFDNRVSENRSLPLQVFFLENGEQTRFRKITKGGMRGTKKYFWDIAVNYQTSKDLATFLENKSWSDFKS